MVTFDWSISIGNILTVGGMIGIWVHGYYSLKSDVRILKHDQRTTDSKVNLINDNIITLNTILTRVAVQDERFNFIEHRIETSEQDIRDLQNGVGFKNENISGEYTRHGKVHD